MSLGESLKLNFEISTTELWGTPARGSTELSRAGLLGLCEQGLGGV